MLQGGHDGVREGNQRSPQNTEQALGADEQLQAIAYSMDALIPGLYIWLGNIRIRMGGSLLEENYPSTIPSQVGIALVLLGYRIHSNFQGSYDPDKH
jgi:hypothetical protein